MKQRKYIIILVLFVGMTGFTGCGENPKIGLTKSHLRQLVTLHQMYLLNNFKNPDTIDNLLASTNCNDEEKKKLRLSPRSNKTLTLITEDFPKLVDKSLKNEDFLFYESVPYEGTRFIAFNSSEIKELKEEDFQKKLKEYQDYK